MESKVQSTVLDLSGTDLNVFLMGGVGFVSLGGVVVLGHGALSICSLG
jgi:hypothetical protein